MAATKAANLSAGMLHYYASLAEDGYCACNCGQGVSQDPAQHNQRGAARRFFASEECALLSWARRTGHLDMVRKIEGKREDKQTRRQEIRAEAAQRLRQLRPGPRPTAVFDQNAADQLDLKYGPRRIMVSVLEQRDRSRRVSLICGHDMTLTNEAKSGRCLVCRSALRSGVAPEFISRDSLTGSAQ